MRSYRTLAFVTLLTVAAVVALYIPGLSGGFFFDDLPSIIHVQERWQGNGWFEFLVEASRGGVAGPFGRPVAQLSFALNHYFSGLDSYAYKATNLLIHVLTGFAVFFVVLKFFASGKDTWVTRNAVVTAFLVSAAWLLHPLQLLTVLHVVQRMTSLSALLLLLALICHMSARDGVGVQRWILCGLAWFVLWPLSVLSKESGLLFPLFVSAWELLLRRPRVGHVDGLGRFIVLSVSVSLVLAIFYLFMPPGAWLLAGYEMRSFTLIERLLTEARGIWFYISLFFYPRLEAFGLYHDDFVVSSSIFSPWTTSFSLIGIFLLVISVWLCRNKRPLLSFGLAWFLIGHLLESSVIPLELIHEHRNYLPLVGLIVALCSVFVPLFGERGWRRTAALAILSSFFILVVLTTYMRAKQFESDLLRTQMESQYHPNSARAHYEAGSLLAQLPDAQDHSSPAYSFALFHFKRAVELDQAQKMGWLGLISLNCDARQPVKGEWLEGLSLRLQNTPFAPGDRNILFFVKELALADRLCLELDQVEKIFSSTYANSSISSGVRAMIHSWHADYLWLVQSDINGAKSHLEKSLSLNPEGGSTRLKLMQLHFMNKDVFNFDQELAQLKSNHLSYDERQLLGEMLSARSLLH